MIDGQIINLRFCLRIRYSGGFKFPRWHSCDRENKNFIPS